jgi:hypothetical protein
MSSAPEEEIRQLREVTRTMQQELTRTKREGMWRMAVGLVLMLAVLLGAVLLVNGWGPSSEGETAKVRRRQQLRFAAEPLMSHTATGSKLRAARTDSLATWSHSLLNPRESGHDQNEYSLHSRSAHDGGLRDVIEAEVEKDFEGKSREQKQLGQLLGKDKTELAWAAGALMGKEQEIADLKKQLATAKSQLAAKKEEAAEKAECECKNADQVYADAMSCEKDLNTVKDTLHHAQQELSQKKSDFRKFLKMLQGTWSETKSLKTQIATLQADHDLSSAAYDLGSDGGTALSTKDKVLQLLGLVKGAHASGSSSIPDMKWPTKSDEIDATGASRPEAGPEAAW